MDIVIFVIYCRFIWFRKALDAEMKDATGSGIAVATKKKEAKSVMKLRKKRKKFFGRRNYWEDIQPNRYCTRCISTMESYSQ